MNLSIRDELAFRAQTQGQSVAIQSLHHTINYDQLYRFTSKAITYFSKLGIQAGQRVLIACPDDVINLMLTLSLMRMGATCCLNHGLLNIKHAKDFDWLLSSRESTDTPVNKLCLISKEMIAEIKQSEIYLGQDQLSELSLIILSSGTTGTHKKIGLSHKRLFERALKFQRIWNLKKSLNLMRLSTALGINHAFTKIFWGDTLYLAENDKEAIDLIRKFHISTLIAAPIQFSQLITELGKSNLLDILNQVIYSGSMAHERLLDTIREKLSVNIHVLYGSTETGGVCSTSLPLKSPLGIAGFVMPGTVIDILKKSEESEWGTVRIKSELAVDTYLDETQLTQEFFKEGWFYPGDEGRLINNNFLILNQRESDILNIGGVKLNPLIIENQIHQAFKLGDLAIFELILPSGQGVVGLAYTNTGKEISLTTEILREELKERLAPIQIPQYIFVVSQIPRNLGGKTLRKNLTETISKNFESSKK